MSTEGLSPCFCGGKFPKRVPGYFSGRPDQGHQIQCSLCGLAAPALSSSDAAEKAWNNLQARISVASQAIMQLEDLRKQLDAERTAIDAFLQKTGRLSFDSVANDLAGAEALLRKHGIT